MNTRILCISLMACAMLIIPITAFADDNTIQLGVPFKLGFNQTATTQEGFQIKFINMTEDSRCPSDVTCVWQGQIKILVEINKNGQSLGNFSLSSLNESISQRPFNHYSIHLIKVDPYPISTKKTQISDYNVTLKLSLFSPLKQFNSGISSEEVTCRQGLTLVIKSKDNSPACVTPQSGEKLVVRGWAKSIS